MNKPKAKARAEIGLKLKALREARLISQAELAKRLEISQAGLSKIERGVSSLNTEDFLQVLRTFNVPASHFYPSKDKGVSEDVIQNALTRLGAGHLYENASLPSENLEQAYQVIREVLADGRNPRHITALAPVIVAQIRHISLSKLWSELAGLGLERRLGWTAENTSEALKLISKPLDTPVAQLHRQAEIVLDRFLGSISAAPSAAYDVLLPDIVGVAAPSERTISSLEKKSSPVSTKWRILSPIKIQDFVDALEASHDAA
jgi:transcriptional regulator with XRE-family HTH domain